MNSAELLHLLYDDKGDISTDAKSLLDPQLREFAYVLNEEDSSRSPSFYYQTLISKGGSFQQSPHGYNGSPYFYVPELKSMGDLTERLIKGEKIKLLNSGEDDIGGLTQYGISYRLLMDNPLSLTGQLLRYRAFKLLDSSGNIHDEHSNPQQSRLIFSNFKHSFAYFMIGFAKRARSLNELARIAPISFTLKFCGYTSFYGAFTMYLLEHGHREEITNRPLNGLQGTRIYSTDVQRVYSQLKSPSELIAFVNGLQPRQFGKYDRKGKILAGTGIAYKNRLIKILKRSL